MWDTSLNKINKYSCPSGCELWCTITNTLHIIITDLFSMIKDGKSYKKERIEQGKEIGGEMVLI